MKSKKPSPITKIDRKVSLVKYNSELAEAEKRISNGEYTTHEALLEESETW